MILTSVPCIMICHNLDKCTMVNHDLATLTMIMASVPWLRTLGIFKYQFRLPFHISCNVRQGTLQKFLKISIKNSKYAISNKHIQDGRPGRYENRRGSKIKAKQHQKTPTPTQERESQRCHHPEGEKIKNCAI